MFARLPSDIHDCILRYVHFEDWVNLTQTSLEFRDTFDTHHYLQLVYENTFKYTIDAYSYRNTVITKRKIHKIYDVLRQLECGQLELTLGNPDSKRALDLLQDPEAYHPIAEQFCNSHRAYLSKYTVENLESTGITSFSRVMVLMKLLEMQNFLVACDYFRNIDFLVPAEEILFENSRFSADFIQYAPSRKPCLDRINLVLDDLLPPVRGIYKFPNLKSFKHLLHQMAQAILFQMNFPLKSQNGLPGNITAYYYCGNWTNGRGAGLPFPLYVIGKFIQERLHDKVEVMVGTEKINTHPSISRGQLIVGGICIIFDDNVRLRLVELRVLQAAGLLLTEHPIEDLMKNLHTHLPHVELPEGDISGVDWSTMLHVSTLRPKADIIERTRENGYDSLEFLEFFEPFLRLTPCMRPQLNTKIKYGHLVYNHYLHLVGIMMDPEPSNGYYQVALLNGDSRVVSREGSLTIITPDMVRDQEDGLLRKFLLWMLFQCNFIMGAGWIFSHLVIEDGYLRLI